MAKLGVNEMMALVRHVTTTSDGSFTNDRIDLAFLRRISILYIVGTLVGGNDIHFATYVDPGLSQAAILSLSSQMSTLDLIAYTQHPNV